MQSESLVKGKEAKHRNIHQVRFHKMRHVTLLKDLRAFINYSGLVKKRLSWKNGCIGKIEVKGVRYITKKNHIWDFKMGGGIGGRWSTEGRYWGV